VKANEIIASMLLTWHNLTFYQDLMAGLREAITRGAFAAYAGAIAARTRTAAAGADSL
jgi:queuine tRNA-ribosyltransferase